LIRPATRERPGAVAPLLVLVVAVAVRVVLYLRLPALVVNDSWDYLHAAMDIRDAGDFFSGALRDVRMPGYPTLLALASPLTGFRSDGVLRLQAALGVATVAIGWAIGRAVGSRRAGLATMAFLALCPVSLLNEHAVMSESFSLLLYVALVAIGLASLRPGAGWMWALAFGLVLGAATLTRANVVVLGVAFAAGMWIADRDVVGARRAFRRPLVAGAVAGIVVAPWLWRNAVAYGQVSLYPSMSSNVLVYKDMHAHLDGGLPELARVNRMLGNDRVDFVWQARLQEVFGSAEAERLSRRILREQIAAHPWRHLADVAESAAGLIGFNFTYGNERSALRWWFRILVGDVGFANRTALEAPGASSLQGWTFVPAPGDSWSTRALAVVGEAYLVPGRAVGFVAFFGLLGWRAVSARARRDAARTRIVLILATAYLGTLAMHAVMLTDYDRYATMFDFVAVVIAALACGDAPMRASRIRTERTGSSMTPRARGEPRHDRPVMSPSVSRARHSAGASRHALARSAEF